MSDTGAAFGKTEAQIWDLNNEEWPAMSLAQKHFWELIKITPEKWLSQPYKFRPREIWVVAIIGTHVIWYDECWFGDEFDGMDSGFTCSNYASHGQIGDSFSGTGSLMDAVRCMLGRLDRF
jgi:hypothetical protein